MISAAAFLRLDGMWAGTNGLEAEFAVLRTRCCDRLFYGCEIYWWHIPDLWRCNVGNIPGPCGDSEFLGGFSAVGWNKPDSGLSQRDQKLPAFEFVGRNLCRGVHDSGILFPGECSLADDMLGADGGNCLRMEQKRNPAGGCFSPAQHGTRGDCNGLEYKKFLDADWCRCAGFSSLPNGLPGRTKRVCDRRINLIALRDTGNNLRDPISGESVLVAGADVAEKLLGLTSWQLAHPVETLASGAVPGVRLIPYHAVGQPGGLLVALRFQRAKIGNTFANPLVAFAPEVLAGGEVYQMLTGGAI